MGIIGERVVRTEDPALLTGGATFVDNLHLPDALHVVYVRSTVAHGRVLAIDATDAVTMPGVVAVLTGVDLAADGLGPLPVDIPVLPTTMPRPALATDVVRFVGELVAVVVAETRSQAVDGAEAVLVDYDVLPAVVDLEDALTDDVVLFPETGTNVCATLNSRGGPLDFSTCEVVVRRTIRNQRIAPSPLEVRSAACRWNDDGTLTQWQASQGAHPVRARLCDWYGLPTSQVRVITPDVGGGFGAKAFSYAEDMLLPWVSRRVGRPVRYIESRSESMNGLGHGRGQVQVVEIGGTRDGRVTHYHLDVVQETGAYPRMGAFMPFMTMRMATGTYDIENVRFTSRSVLTNTVPTVAYRGAGRPEAAAAIERAMDLFAAEIGMDPAEVRRRNVVTPDRFPYTTPMRTVYDSGDYPGALERVLEVADYAALREEQAARRAAGDVVQMGIGVSVYVEVTAMSGGSEHGSVEVIPDGDDVRVRVVTGSTPYGQGHRTTWAMLVSDRLGIPMDRIEVIHGDTAAVPTGEVTGGSRSVQLAGTNVWRAAEVVMDRARDVAARLLEADSADVVFDNGSFHVAGTPSITKSWLDVTRAASASGDHLSGLGDFAQEGGSYPSGAHLAVVDVDTETGGVVLRRMVAVDDAGRIINPLLAEGQVHGGLAQGIGQALFEEVVYDRDGNNLTSTFADYGFPSAAEVPSFETVHMETPSPLNDLGAKGIGESGTIGATPAVQNAVVDAVSHLGVRHVDLPCTSERVWAAIQDAMVSTGR